MPSFFLNTTISLVLPWKKGWPVVDHPHVLVATIGEATNMLRYILLLLLPCSMGMICKLPHAKQKMSNKQWRIPISQAPKWNSPQFFHVCFMLPLPFLPRPQECCCLLCWCSLAFGWRGIAKDRHWQCSVGPCPRVLCVFHGIGVGLGVVGVGENWCVWFFS